MDEGLIERVKQGYYHWIEDSGESEIVIINRLFPDAVLCMETALFYYRYSDRNPAEWNFAIDKNVSKLRTKIDYPFIKAYRVKPALVTLGETRGNVDIGAGDVIVPRAEERKINTQLSDFEAPVIITYSLQSTIAEKFDAILQRLELTGRMKDFYDIYYLARTFDFYGAELQTAIFETLQRRGTPYDSDSFKS